MTHRTDGGFTLLEIVIAVTITSLLLVTVYGVFASVSGARERVAQRAEGYHRARVIFDRIGREVRSAYTKAGQRRTLFSGGHDREGRPFLRLTTAATTPQGGIMTGLAQVEYVLVEDPEEPDNKVLLRSERPLLGGGEEDVSEYPLAEGLHDFQLRFFSNGDWLEEWEEGLPLMIEVSLAMVIEGRTIPFTTAFEIAPITGPVP